MPKDCRCPVCRETMIRRPDGSTYCRWKCDPALARPFARRAAVERKINRAVAAACRGGFPTKNEARDGLAKVDRTYLGDWWRASQRVSRGRKNKKSRRKRRD